MLGTYGGTGQSTVAVTFNQYASGTTPTGPGTASAPSATNSIGVTGLTGFYSGSEILTNSIGPAAFDIGIDFAISGASGVSQITAQLQPVPVPAAALLFGSALIGTFMVGRRRKESEEDGTIAA